ncbi:MAG TPA: hypothetical protein VK501_20945 [Baekduia sp.]|uniref:hypothetical protein n=1 Tax=Baekduia sp. TaxID=2600305 RepID=UPI002D039E95|nr:hypothetical protein [Baekduia sp.]HMJ36383.1 hypothetical protein [Baekduia sp.]
MTARQGISGGIAAPTTRLSWSDSLGKRIRDGGPAALAVSTVERIEAAIDAQQWEVAAQLVDYFMEEAKVCHLVYTTWVEGFEGWLRQQGVTAAELAAERERLDLLLRFDDGAPFEPHVRWTRVGERAGGLGNDLRGMQAGAGEAHARVAALAVAWRDLHDRWADLQAGLMGFVAARFGEAAIGECYRAVLEPFLQERYRPFDVRQTPYDQTVERNLYLAFEAMRAHLVGPDRLGNMQVTEHEDRWVIAFDPCGSGGRQTRNGGFAGTGFTEERHDWAWNQEGVCHYCAHCCLTNELWAVEQWGAPVRVTQPPLRDDPQRPCTWTIYKTAEAVPAWAYERIGREKPAG